MATQTNVDIRKGDIEKKPPVSIFGFLLCSVEISNSWLYWPAIFVGTSIVDSILRKKFVGR
jgi:hypothetical protein